MSYEFIKTYNVAVESGCSTITGFTMEENSQRAEAVKSWFDENFGDIFVTETVLEGSENQYTVTKCYFKGTDSGIKFVQYNNNNNNNNIGFFRGSSSANIKLGVALARSEVNFYIAKSKYGFITGFYGNDISTQVKAVVIYHNNTLYPIFLNGNSTSYICYDMQSETFTLTKRGETSKAVLTTFAVPYLDFVPEGIYWSIGASPSTMGIYNVGSSNKQFIELACIPYYNSIALELAEPSATDYKDIKDIPRAEATGNVAEVEVEE